MNNSPVSFPELPLGTVYEAMHARFRWQAAEIRGRAIEAGEMVCALIDPDRAEPEHVRGAIQKLHRQFFRKIAARLKTWQPSDLEKSQ
jgi:hypothetical protein